MVIDGIIDDDSFQKMMTQSVKIVKLKEVKQLVANVLMKNDDNDSLKKIWAHTIGGQLRIITIIYYIYLYIYKYI